MANSTHKSPIIGVLLVIVGGFLLLDNLNWIPFELRSYLFNWKGVLLIIGTVMLATKDKRTPGIILIIIALFFISTDIFHWYWNINREIFWPAILIILGLVIIVRRGSTSHPDLPEMDGSMDYINDTNIFGGGEVVVSSKSFRGGKVTSIFGGANYDMTNAELSNDVNVIDLFAVFGGSSFIVPSNWNVRVEVVSIFGGFSDKRKLRSDFETNTEKQIFIKGVVLFGGGEIKSFG